MKIKSLFSIQLILGLFILFFFSSCRKDYFDNINSIEASGTWGLPLINSEVYIEDILRFFADAEVQEDAASGMLQFSLFMDSTQLIRPIEILSITSRSYDNSFSFPAPSDGYTPPVNEFEVTFEGELLIDNNFIIEEGIIKSGQLTIDINTDIDQPTYMITITSPHILNENDQSFYIRFEPSQLSRTIDLAGQKIILTNPNNPNKISFTTIVYFDSYVSSPLPQYTVNTQFTLQSLFFSFLKGKMNPKVYPVRFENPMSFFSGNLDGNFTFLNPKYYVRVGNSIGAATKFITDSVGFIGENFYSELLNSGTELNCAASSGNGYYEISEFNGIGNEMPITKSVEKFLFEGDAIINPSGMGAGSIFIDEKASLFVTSNVEVMLESKFDFVEYKDTLDLQLENNDYISVVDEATLRLVIRNGIPLAGKVQVYFYDSERDEVIDVLLSSTQLFQPAVVGGAPDYRVISETIMPPKFITMSGSRYEKIIKADKIILSFRLFSPNAQDIIRIYQDQKLNISLGAKVKYNTNSLSL